MQAPPEADYQVELIFIQSQQVIIINQRKLFYSSSKLFFKIPLIKRRRGNAPSAVKYFPNIFDFNYVFFQGGLGLPLLFYYPVDFNISIGAKFHNIQLEIREIYYLEIGGHQEVNLKHWPMFAILFGISI